MKCPVCHNPMLEPEEMEPGLVVQTCPQCSGHWLAAARYWEWRERHGENLPEKDPGEEIDLPVVENRSAKLCPDCGRLLVPYRVGHHLPFSLDRCGGCGGIWIDNNEWEILKSRNLHDDLHRIFSRPWQAQVEKEEHAAERERLLREKFGEADLAEIRRIRDWLASHPLKRELLALLMNDQP